MNLSERLLEEFPWLNTDEPVSGADVVDELSQLYKSLQLPTAKIKHKQLTCPKCGDHHFTYLEDIVCERDISELDGKIVQIDSIPYSQCKEKTNNPRLQCQKCFAESLLPKAVEVCWV